MSRLFRGKFLAGLQQLYQAGRLGFHGSTAALADPSAFAALRDRLYRREWIVYAKPPFGSVEQVYRYLGRYSHRVAIANSRLLGMENDRVRFRYKDYRDGDRWKVMQVSAEEFTRRFLLHVLPKRFVRIRHYGLMSGRHVMSRLQQARRLLSATVPPIESALIEGNNTGIDSALNRTEPDVLRCPCCHAPLVRLPLDDEPRAASGRQPTRLLPQHPGLDSS